MTWHVQNQFYEIRQFRIYLLVLYYFLRDLIQIDQISKY